MAEPPRASFDDAVRGLHRIQGDRADDEQRHGVSLESEARRKAIRTVSVAGRRDIVNHAAGRGQGPRRAGVPRTCQSDFLVDRGSRGGLRWGGVESREPRRGGHDPRPGRAETALRRPDAPRPAPRRVARACWGWACRRDRGAGGATPGRPVVRRRVRPGEGVHPAVPVRLAQPARDVRPQARRPRGDPRRVEVDPLARAGPRRLRAAAEDGPGDGQGHGHPLASRTRTRSTGSPSRRPASPGSTPRWNSARATRRTGRSSARWSITSTRRRRGPGGRGRSRATSSSPGRSAAGGSARSPAPGLTAGSSAGAGTRSSPSSSARRPARRKKTLAEKTWEDLEPYRGVTPESRFRLGAVADLGPDPDARPPRPPPVAAGPVRGRAAARSTPRSPRASTATARWPTRCSAPSTLPPGLRPRRRDRPPPATSTG